MSHLWYRFICFYSVNLCWLKNCQVCRRWSSIQLSDLTTLLVGKSKHFFTWNGMYLSSESGEIRGLSFKAIILLISELLSIKMTEICVWKTCQQDIYTWAQNLLLFSVLFWSGFFGGRGFWLLFWFIFQIQLKIAFHILRSYRGIKHWKKMCRYKTKTFFLKLLDIFSQHCCFGYDSEVWLVRQLGIFFTRTLLMLWTMPVQWFGSWFRWNEYTESCKQHCWQCPRCIQSIHTMVKKGWNWSICRWTGWWHAWPCTLPTCAQLTHKNLALHVWSACFLADCTLACKQ